MKLLLGDVHGCWGELNIVMAKAFRQFPEIDSFIQVGDFSYAWPGAKPFKFLPTYWENADMERAMSIPFYWVDGNHENHDRLDADGGASQPGMTYQPRGSTLDFGEQYGRAMFFGGASSIDKPQRIEGKSWWPQESIKYGQVMSALEKEGPINLIVSHEHPSAFPYKSYKDNFGRADKDALDALRQQFEPKFWAFGHHHAFGQGVTEGTQWVCVPIIESMQAVLWDGEDFRLLRFAGRSKNYLNDRSL